jgi:hypothetical protein
MKFAILALAIVAGLAAAIPAKAGNCVTTCNRGFNGSSTCYTNCN